MLVAIQFQAVVHKPELILHVGVNRFEFYEGIFNPVCVKDILRSKIHQVIPAHSVGRLGVVDHSSALGELVLGLGGIHFDQELAEVAASLDRPKVGVVSPVSDG